MDRKTEADKLLQRFETRGGWAKDSIEATGDKAEVERILKALAHEDWLQRVRKACRSILGLIEYRNLLGPEKQRAEITELLKRVIENGT